MGRFQRFFCFKKAPLLKGNRAAQTFRKKMRHVPPIGALTGKDNGCLGIILNIFDRKKRFAIKMVQDPPHIINGPGKGIVPHGNHAGKPCCLDGF